MTDSIHTKENDYDWQHNAKKEKKKEKHFAFNYVPYLP